MKRFGVVGSMGRLMLGVGAASWIVGCAATKDKGNMPATMDATRKSEYNSSAYWLGEQPSKSDYEWVEPAKEQPRGSCASYRPAVGTGMGLSEMHFPTGDKQSSGLMVQAVTPVQVRSNQPFTYEIHVTNITRGTLKNVMVRDESIDNRIQSNATISYESGPNGLALWNLGDMAPCETKVIKVTAKAGKAGVSNECISASYNNSLCTVTMVADPALTLTKTATQEAMACDTVALKYDIRNTGTGIAEGVRLRDPLAAGLTTLDGKSAVDMDIGNIPAGETRTVTIQAKASKAGRFESAASASGSGGLTAESTRTATVIRQPTLAVSVKCPDRVFFGREVNYEITVRNTGDGASANTMVTAGLPGGSTFVKASDNGGPSGGGVSWALGTLAPNATKTLTFTTRPGGMGASRTTSTAQGTCAPAVTGDCQTELVGIPALMLNGFDNPDPIQIGESTTYTLLVTNQGSAALNNVKLVCTMDEGDTMTYVSSGGQAQGTVSGRTITFPAIARLNPDGKATYTVVIRAAKEGQVSFRAEATSDEITRPLVKAETTNFYR